MAEWQPIETAPRDGTPVIGAFWTIRWADSHRKGDVVRCWYQPEFDAFISSCRQMSLAAGYTFDDGRTQKLHSPVVEPVTHWMPLPAFVSDESSAAPLSQEAYIKMKERALDAEQEIERLREALKLARTDLMVAIREIDRELLCGRWMELSEEQRDA